MNEMIQVGEKYIGHKVKECATPGIPEISLQKGTEKDLIVEPEKYRSVIGKIMYLVTKIWIEGSNPARELVKCFFIPHKGTLGEHGKNEWLSQKI